MRVMDLHECVATVLVCTQCGASKPATEFYFSTKKGSYIKPCKTCQSAAGKERYERNRAAVLARQKKRQADKRDEIAAYAKRWYEKNKEWYLAQIKQRRLDPEVRERELARQKRYYAERAPEIQAKRKTRQTPEQLARHRAMSSEWAKRNKARVAAKVRGRQARINGATPAWVDVEAIRRVYEDAERLTVELHTAHEVDHIVPLKSPIVCGLHVPWNLQILPRVLNRSKGNKLEG